MINLKYSDPYSISEHQSKKTWSLWYFFWRKTWSRYRNRRPVHKCLLNFSKKVSTEVTQRRKVAKKITSSVSNSREPRCLGLNFAVEATETVKQPARKLEKWRDLLKNWRSVRVFYLHFLLCFWVWYIEYGGFPKKRFSKHVIFKKSTFGTRLSSKTRLRKGRKLKNSTRVSTPWSCLDHCVSQAGRQKTNF